MQLVNVLYQSNYCIAPLQCPRRGRISSNNKTGGGDTVHHNPTRELRINAEELAAGSKNYSIEFDSNEGSEEWPEAVLFSCQPPPLSTMTRWASIGNDDVTMNDEDWAEEDVNLQILFIIHLNGLCLATVLYLCITRIPLSISLSHSSWPLSILLHSTTHWLNSGTQQQFIDSDYYHLGNDTSLICGFKSFRRDGGAILTGDWGELSLKGAISSALAKCCESIKVSV